MNARPRALVVLAALALVACGSPESPKNEITAGETLTVTGDSGVATAKITAGSTIAEGRNTFLVAFQPSGVDLTAASAMMPSMGHGSPTPTIAATATGYTVSNVIFSMPGLWEILLDVTVDGKADRLEFSTDVP